MGGWKFGARHASRSAPPPTRSCHSLRVVLFLKAALTGRRATQLFSASTAPPFDLAAIARRHCAAARARRSCAALARSRSRSRSAAPFELRRVCAPPLAEDTVPNDSPPPLRRALPARDRERAGGGGGMGEGCGGGGGVWGGHGSRGFASFLSLRGVGLQPEDPPRADPPRRLETGAWVGETGAAATHATRRACDLEQVGSHGRWGFRTGGNNGRRRRNTLVVRGV